MFNFYKINDNKFKSIYISVNYTMPVENTQVSENSVLSAILSKGCKKYKNQKEIEKRLYELYGANFDVNVELLGDLYNIEFRMECINKKYLPNNDDVFYKCLDLLFNIIYEQNIQDDKFDEKLVEREKEYILDKIKTRKDDKLKYSVVKTEYFMCKNEPFGRSIYGIEDDVENVTSENLVKRYNEVINNSCVTVIISGNLDGYDNLENGINEAFFEKLNSNIPYDKLVTDTRNEKELLSLEEIFEKQDTTQSVITFGMRINDLSNEDYYRLNVFNAILGSTPSSKLFQNFREKESLAYTVRSRCYRFKGIMVIYAGIEDKNYEKAKECINYNINEIKNGNITNEELNAAKESLVSDILEWNDSKIALAKMLFTNLICKNDSDITIQDMIDGINSVTIDDVINISNRFYVEKIFLLGGGNNV